MGYLLSVQELEEFLRYFIFFFILRQVLLLIRICTKEGEARPKLIAVIHSNTIAAKNFNP